MVFSQPSEDARSPLTDALQCTSSLKPDEIPTHDLHLRALLILPPSFRPATSLYFSGYGRCHLIRVGLKSVVDRLTRSLMRSSRPRDICP